MNALSISESVKQLSQHINAEIDKLGQRDQKEKPTDSLVYVGNWQDAIPRSIWSDATLDAIDVRSWGIIRTQAIHQSAVMLSLNDLLKERLGYSKATISKVLYILRLTGWISLCSQSRTGKGKFRRSIYAIHDSPVALGDAIYLDKDYLSFVEQQTSHRNKKISLLARQIWQSIDQSIRMDGNIFQSASTVQTSLSGVLGGITSGRIYTVNQPGNQQNTRVYNMNLDENHRVQNMNPVKNDQVQKMNPDEKKQESQENQQVRKNNEESNTRVQNMNPAICSSSSKDFNFFENDLKEKTTTTTNSAGILNTDEKNKLIYPEKFNANEIKLSAFYLQGIESEFQQWFLDETAAKIHEKSKTSKPIRNPIAYLGWLCSEHKKGNTYLTSSYLQHQEKREREILKNQQIKQKQEEVVRLSQKQKARSGVDDEEPDIVPFDEEEIKRNKKKRWEGLKQGKIRPKNV